MNKNDGVALFWSLIITALLFPATSEAGALAPLINAQLISTPDNPLTEAKIELGKKLFFDRRLSGDGTMSCASCHIPALTFTDGQAISLNYPTTRNWRNAPTLINLPYYDTLFHDGRSGSIEEQALFPILSAFEMNQNLDYLEEEIRAVPAYQEAFRQVYGTPDTNRQRIAQALAAFERTLISQNAPLDRFLAGDETALSKEMQKGYAIFTGKGRCTTCHYGLNLIDNQFHALDVPENEELSDPRVAATRRFVAKINGYEDFRQLREDPGRYLITKNPKDWKAFRTPTLRNIALTAPYMHNGTFETLEEVVDFFDKGNTTTLPSLHLTEQERKALILFLNSALTGEEIGFTFPILP